MDEIKVKRTGRSYSIASNEFLITFPDGVESTLWSPPWNDMTTEEEDACATEKAIELWKEYKQTKDNDEIKGTFYGTGI